MKWPPMTADELHAFGIEAILPHLEKEGITVHSVNPDLEANPQIVGERWGATTFIAVRTACCPDKGALTLGSTCGSSPGPTGTGQLLSSRALVLPAHGVPRQNTCNK